MRLKKGPFNVWPSYIASKIAKVLEKRRKAIIKCGGYIRLFPLLCNDHYATTNLVIFFLLVVLIELLVVNSAVI